MKNPLIVIIEDSPIITEIITHILESQLKARVISFDSAESAIRDLFLYDPDVILLDYNLNSSVSLNMSGLHFLRKMQLTDKSSSVIMMSGQRDKRITADILKSGVVNYLSKDDENFLDNMLTQVKLVLEVLEMDKVQKEQRKELKKQIIRIAAFILVPIGITLLSLYSLS